MDLVYMSDDGVHLLVSTREAAEYQQRVYDALNSAKTWGEFRELLPDQEMESHPDFEEMFDEHEEDEAFVSEQVYGVGDGDYQASPAYDMEYLIPEEYTVSTRLHGDQPQIPVSVLPRLKAALEAEGHTLTEF